MSTDTKPSLHARRFAEAPVLEESIERIVRELEQHQASMTGAQPPTQDLVAGYAQTLEHFAGVRGRGPFFPYLGSGFGHGPLVELADGSVKWDMINGIGVHMFGHGDPDMVRTALRAATGDTVMQGNLQCNTDAVDYATLLVEEAGRNSGIRHCFLTNSGAMANESALKICQQRKDGRAPRVLAFADCFMGRTTTLAQIGDGPGGRAGLPLNVFVDYVPFYDADHGERSIEYAAYHVEQYVQRYPGQHACFVMELVQGEGGFNVAPPAFFRALIEVCRANDIPVWADEIQTFGRTTSMYRFDALGLGDVIDVVTIGKMSQACACLYTEAMNPKPGLLSGTFIGSTAALQVGRRALERLRDGGYYGEDGRIARLFAAFTEHAKAMAEKHPDWFPEVPHPRGLRRVAPNVHGGVGGMMRLTPFGGDKQKILRLLHNLFEQGVIAFYCGHDPYHLRFLPPVGVMRPEQFADVFEIVEAALAATAAES